MKMLRSTWCLLLLSLFLLLETGLAACAAPQNAASPIPSSPTPTPIASITPTPIPFTPTAAATATATRLPTLTPVPTPMPGGLYVDASKSLGAISRFSYGTNFGPWGLVTTDLQQEYLKSGITFIRYPGGNHGDQYDLEEWQIDQFIAMARQINAEPQISVRLLGGTPEKAVAAINYTRAKNYNLRYWSIGNEPSLYAPSKPEWNTEYYNAEWRKFALAMKAADPDIRLLGPEIHQFTGEPTVDPKDQQGRDWLREFLKTNGDLVDIVSVHRYPFPIQMGERPTRAELLADAPRWDSLVANLRAVIRETTGRDLPIAITEFNSNWAGANGGETGLDTFNSALWLADVLGRLIRQRVDIVAQFSLQSGAPIGGFGLLDRYTVRPSYYVYQMYQHFGEELIYASSDNPTISIYAARRGNVLTILLINLSEQPQTRTMTLDHFVPSGRADVRLFDAQHKAEEMPAIACLPKFDYSLPPASVTLLTISGQVK